MARWPVRNLVWHRRKNIMMNRRREIDDRPRRGDLKHQHGDSEVVLARAFVTLSNLKVANGAAIMKFGIRRRHCAPVACGRVRASGAKKERKNINAAKSDR